MDQPDFDPYEIDADGLPLVYNEERIATFWKGKFGMCFDSLSMAILGKIFLNHNLLQLAGELSSRWARFAAVSGEQHVKAQLQQPTHRNHAASGCYNDVTAIVVISHHSS